MKYLDEKIEGTNYKLKFNWCYIDCNNFKEKELILLRNTIACTRISNDITFYKYANISFDENDKKHETPIVTEFDNFTRSKTNAIIFDMKNTEKNPGKFNKCIIYQHIMKNDGFYGFVFYNTETGRYNHIYNITNDRNELLVNIWRSIDIMQREEMYSYYMNRANTLSNK